MAKGHADTTRWLKKSLLSKRGRENNFWLTEIHADGARVYAADFYRMAVAPASECGRDTTFYVGEDAAAKAALMRKAIPSRKRAAIEITVNNEEFRQALQIARLFAKKDGGTVANIWIETSGRYIEVSGRGYEGDAVTILESEIRTFSVGETDFSDSRGVSCNAEYLIDALAGVTDAPVVVLTFFAAAGGGAQLTECVVSAKPYNKVGIDDRFSVIMLVGKEGGEDTKRFIHVPAEMIARALSNSTPMASRRVPKAKAARAKRKPYTLPADGTVTVRVVNKALIAEKPIGAPLVARMVRIKSSARALAVSCARRAENASAKIVAIGEDILMIPLRSGARLRLEATPTGMLVGYTGFYRGRVTTGYVGICEIEGGMSRQRELLADVAEGTSLPVQRLTVQQWRDRINAAERRHPVGVEKRIEELRQQALKEKEAPCP
jgi:hypothetical protein